MKTAAIRCKIVTTDQPITFRKVRNEVEGEILTIIPSKVWRYWKTHYMTGEIKSKRIDIPALNIEPLALNEMWVWDPKEEYWAEPDDPLKLRTHCSSSQNLATSSSGLCLPISDL